MWITETKYHDFSMKMSYFLKFHDFSKHGTFLGQIPGFPGEWERIRGNPAHCYVGDAYIPRRQKSHYPDNTIHWPKSDVMLGYRL